MKLKDFFNLSKSEFNSLCVLFLVICFLLSIKILYLKYRKHQVNNIYFDDKFVRQEFNRITNGSKKVTTSKHDINSISLDEIISLNINDKIARRIIKYRDLLGGFINVKQYKEVYGISEQDLKILYQYTHIKNNFIPKKILISKDNFKQLLRHPYIDLNSLKNIMKYIETNKIFTIKDLIDQKLLPQKAEKYVSTKQNY